MRDTSDGKNSELRRQGKRIYPRPRIAAYPLTPNGKEYITGSYLQEWKVKGRGEVKEDSLTLC